LIRFASVGFGFGEGLFLGFVGGLSLKFGEGGLSGFIGVVGLPPRFGGYWRKFCEFFGVLIDACLIDRYEAVRMACGFPALERFVKLASIGFEFFEHGLIGRARFRFCQLARSLLVLDDRIARFKLLLPQVHHLQINGVGIGLIRFPTAGVVFPEHPHGANRHEHARDRKNAMELLGIAPGGFVGGHSSGREW